MYQNLSNQELLKILVAERAGEDVTINLLSTFPTLPILLANSAEEELLQVKGMGTKRVSQLKACYELARRLYSSQQNPTQIIKSPVDVVALLRTELMFLQKERFYIIILDTKNHVVESRLVSEGSLNSSIVHPREVFAWAVKRSASGIVCCHNHPSGDPEPSREDIETTQRLVNAGNVLGIKLLDHVVFGDGNYISFKERGLM